MRRTLLPRGLVLAALLAAFVVFLLASCAGAEGGQVDPGLESSALALAAAYIDAGSYEKALEVCDRALDCVKSPKILYNKMLCLAYLGRFEEADVLGAAAMEAHPAYLSFPLARIEFYRRQGKTAEAALLAREVLEIDPWSEEAALILLDLLLDEGKTEEAKELARTMAKRGIGTQEAKKVLLSWMGGAVAGPDRAADRSTVGGNADGAAEGSKGGINADGTATERSEMGENEAGGQKDHPAAADDENRVEGKLPDS